MSVERPHTSHALWIAAPGQAVLLEAPLAAPLEGEARVRTTWSAISRGTERLVFNGQVPPSEYERMRAPFQDGAFPFPVKYGYCAVGIVEDGPEALLGRSVFALHPHQDHFVLRASALTLVPDNVPPRRAVLAANMETALNALWDSGAGPGDRIVVVGGGGVGLLTAALAARLPGADVTLIDPDVRRADIAAALGIGYAPEPSAHGFADVVFHTSSSAGGLASAIACAGTEARIIEMSWYGERQVAAPLGGAFHSQRLTLQASQVGQIAPSRRPRWDYARRLAKALELLDDARLDALLTHDVAFADLPGAMAGLLADDAAGVVSVVRYG